MNHVKCESDDRPFKKIRKPLLALDNYFTASFQSRIQWFSFLMLPVALTINFYSILSVSLAYSAVAGVASFKVIPSFAKLLANAGISGKDLHRTDNSEIPESLGIAAGAVYLICMFLFLPIPFLSRLLPSLQRSDDIPFELLGQYTAALLSITCMLFLGFADDILNLKWRNKILLPAISILPLLMIYSVTSNRTVVVVPFPLRSFFESSIVDLGFLYYFYMILLSIFCTHSINILAGINGVEPGQTLIISLSVILHNIFEIYLGNDPAGTHQFSLTLILPFSSVCASLLYYNWWPASVFVGDTFCYFSGMTLAVSGILGHFGKTLILFFIPQIFNFVYSSPQLFKIMPCPRHRLPNLDSKNNLLTPSVCVLERNHLNTVVINILSKWRMIRIYSDQKGILKCISNVDTNSDCIIVNNLTLLNLILVNFGDLKEDVLAKKMIFLQITCSFLAFCIRHFIADYFFP